MATEVLDQTTQTETQPDVIEAGHDAALESLRTAAGQEQEPEGATPGEPMPESSSAIDESLLFDAQRCGFDKEDIDGLPRDRVEKMIRAYDKALANSVWNPPNQAQNNGQTTQQEPPGILPAVRPFDFKFDANMPEDQVQAAFAAQNKYFAETMNGVVKAVNQKFYEHQQSLEAVQAIDTIRAFDGFLANLGPEWKDVVGEGATLEMNEKSAAFGKREEILKTYNGLKRDAAMRRQQVSDLELFRRAHGAVCSDQIRSKERARVNGAVANRQKQFIQRPGERASAPSKESAHDLALKTLRQGFAVS